MAISFQITSFTCILLKRVTLVTSRIRQRFEAVSVRPLYPSVGSRSEIPKRKISPMMQLYAAPVQATR